MESRRQWILVIVIIVILDFAALGFSSFTAMSVSTEQKPFAVSELFRTALLGEEVFIKGSVTEVLPEYTSEKGYNYQQFMLSDGDESIKLFCSAKYGKSEAKAGDEIIFEGTFQKYGITFEIYGFCSEIKVL
jgi:hypothetical protein